MTNAVVIGGGISGMVTAILLKRRGWQVSLVESSRELAPVFRGFNRGVHYHDTGFHYAGSMEKGEITRRIFDFLEISESIRSVPYPQDCFDVVYEPGTRNPFRFPHGWQQITSAFSDRFPREKDAIENYFQTARDIYDRLPADSLKPRISLPLQQSYLGAGLCLQEYLDTHFNDPFLKYLLSVHCVLYGMTPSEAPLDYHLRVMSTFFQSVGWIPGGGSTLVSALESKITQGGIPLHLGATLEHLDIGMDNRILSGRLSTGGQLTADVWVFSGNPKQLTSVLPGNHQAGKMKKRLQSFQETSSAIVLYGTINISNGFDLTCNRLFNDRHLGDEASETMKTTLFFVPAKEGKNGKVTFTLIAPSDWQQFAHWAESSLGRRPAGYRAAKTALIRNTIKRLESCSPELAARIEITEAATPLTMRHYSGNPEGSLYGLKHRISDFMLTPKTRIPNLFLTGQSTLAPGLTGAMMSALQTAAYILETDEYANAISP